MLTNDTKEYMLYNSIGIKSKNRQKCLWGWKRESGCFCGWRGIDCKDSGGNFLGWWKYSISCFGSKLRGCTQLLKRTEQLRFVHFILTHLKRQPDFLCLLMGVHKTHKIFLTKTLNLKSDQAPRSKYQFIGNRGDKETYLITFWGCESFIVGNFIEVWSLDSRKGPYSRPPLAASFQMGQEVHGTKGICHCPFQTMFWLPRTWTSHFIQPTPVFRACVGLFFSSSSQGLTVQPGVAVCRRCRLSLEMWVGGGVGAGGVGRVSLRRRWSQGWKENGTACGPQASSPVQQQSSEEL